MQMRDLIKKQNQIKFDQYSLHGRQATNFRNFTQKSTSISIPRLQKFSNSLEYRHLSLDTKCRV